MDIDENCDEVRKNEERERFFPKRQGRDQASTV
jgi:hypothetical protein